jgi:uncharacterized protein
MPVMPHQCVRCGTFYENGSNEIIQGCPCGAKLFFFVKEEKMAKAKQMSENLSLNEKEQMVKDVFDIIGVSPETNAVVLDLESINIQGPGKFEIDLVKLFDKKKPMVYKLEEGKYVIDIAETFLRTREE